MNHLREAAAERGSSQALDPSEASRRLRQAREDNEMRSTKSEAKRRKKWRGAWEGSQPVAGAFRSLCRRRIGVEADPCRATGTKLTSLKSA